MPYIRPENRDAAMNNPIDAGELNYALSSIIAGYLRRTGESYQTINDCIGALEGAKLEAYRRIAVPLEDRKLKENGDVY